MKWRKIVVTFVFLLLVLFQYIDGTRKTQTSLFSTHEIKTLVKPTSLPFLKRDFLCNPCGVQAVHAASLVYGGSHGTSAYWYGGRREGSRDAQIYQSHWRDEDTSWTDPSAILSTADVKQNQRRFIKKLGNVVGIEDPNGIRTLYFVSVSVGGWSGSAINRIQSLDGGTTWGRASRIVTSPFFNVSTLVRTKPFRYADGTVALPAYHEFAGKYAELIHLSQTGEVLAKHRISDGRRSLQPALMPQGNRQAIALMRNSGPISGRRVWYSKTKDAGESWKPLLLTNVPNPDSAITVIQRPNGELLMVANDSESNRSRLSLFASGDGIAWQRIANIEESRNNRLEEYSYPSIVKDKRGLYHLVYTWKRKAIRHVRFNESWVDQQIKVSKQ